MDPRIEALKYERSNSDVWGNDVHVDFEYEKLANHQIKLFMTAYVGDNKDNYRFCLKLIYIVDMIHDGMSESDIAEVAIKSVMHSFTQLIILLDPIVCEDEEEESH